MLLAKTQEDAKCKQIAIWRGTINLFESSVLNFCDQKRCVYEDVDIINIRETISKELTKSRPAYNRKTKKKKFNHKTSPWMPIPTYIQSLLLLLMKN
jgi:hypothetical protein